MVTKLIPVGSRVSLAGIGSSLGVAQIVSMNGNGRNLWVAGFARIPSLLGREVSMDIKFVPFEDQHGPLDPDALMKQGWVYRDVPWCTLDAWALLIKIIGSDNYRLLAQSERNDAVRGQMLISPKGMDNLKNHKEAPK